MGQSPSLNGQHSRDDDFASTKSKEVVENHVSSKSLDRQGRRRKGFGVGASLNEVDRESLYYIQEPAWQWNLRRIIHSSQMRLQHEERSACSSCPGHKFWQFHYEPT